MQETAWKAYIELGIIREMATSPKVSKMTIIWGKMAWMTNYLGKLVEPKKTRPYKLPDVQSDAILKVWRTIEIFMQKAANKMAKNKRKQEPLRKPL